MKIQTYNGNAISALWTAIGFAFISIVFFASQKINILPTIILLYAIGTFVTGKIIDFKPLVIGGSICFLLSIVIAFIKDENHLLIMAAAILISYIIPGFLLKKEYKNQQA